jgi:hypothetical protein
MSDEFYYQKYLKYKNKYLALKEYEGGGVIWSFETGIIAYFCNTESANLICKQIQEKALSSQKINEILSKEPVAFKGKKGKSELHFITKSLYNSASANRKIVNKAMLQGAKDMARGTAGLAVSGANFVASGTKAMARGTGNLAKDAGKTIISPMRKGREDLLIGGAKEKEKVKVLKDANGPIIIDTNNDDVLRKIILGLQKTYPTINSVVVINYSPMGSICLKKLTDISGPPSQLVIRDETITEHDI